MTKPHKHAEVIKAWADGSEIERNWEDGGWGPVSACPTWNPEAEYRIKPAPTTTNNESKAAMTKPEHTRPFNLEDAKAGAPYCCRDGTEATVFKWDGRNQEFPLSGIRSDDDVPACWKENGQFLNRDESMTDLVMTPLGEIDGKPVFVGDKVDAPNGHRYSVQPEDQERADFLAKCVWPAPARQYPVTGMTGLDLREKYLQFDGDEYESCIAIANAALRHAIDADTVRITEEVKARELAIAEAVAEAVTDAIDRARNSTTLAPIDVDLEAIIASVKD